MLRRLTGILLASVSIAVFGLVGQAFADSSTLIGMVNGGDIYVKAGSVNSPWSTRLTTGETATQLEMYGDRVAFVDSANNLWLKQGLTSQWYEEIGNVQSYALTETGLLVLQTGGNVWYKAGQPQSQWDSNLIANNGSKVYLSPSQLLVLDTSGNLSGKMLAPLDGIGQVGGQDGPWIFVTSSASAAAITDSRFMYIDTSGNVYDKEGPMWYSWYNNKAAVDINVQQIKLLGNLYCDINLTQTTPQNQWSELYCNDSGFGQGSKQLFAYQTNTFALAPDELVLYGNDTNNYQLYGMNFSAGNISSNGGWNVLSTNGTDITTNQQ